jgi:hypothetical protein
LHFVLILNLHYMEVNGQLHASVALPTGIANLLATEEEAGCGLEPVWTLCRRQPLLSLPGIEPTFDGCPAPVRTPANVPAAGVSRLANLLQIAKSRSEPIGTAAVGAPVTSAAAVVLYRQMFFTCPCDSGVLCAHMHHWFRNHCMTVAVLNTSSR